MTRARRVIVWRHGRTAWNLAGRVQGQSDVPLDEVGVAQARDAAGYLAALEPSRILSSDLKRAASTAAALSAVTGIPVELDKRFREMDFGAREGLTWPQAWEAFPEGMQAWVNGDETKIPGSETHEQAGRRFAAALEDHLEELPLGDTLVVVAHGALLRTGLCAFLGFEVASWRLFGGLANCNWSILEESRHGDWAEWRLTEWNTGSLPEPVLSDDEQTERPVDEPG